MALIITVVWALGIAADAALESFSLSPFVYAIMIGTASAVFGTNFRLPK
jgi:hypothetical protein